MRAQYISWKDKNASFSQIEKKNQSYSVDRVSLFLSMHVGTTSKTRALKAARATSHRLCGKERQKLELARPRATMGKSLLSRDIVPREISSTISKITLSLR